MKKICPLCMLAVIAMLLLWTACKKDEHPGPDPAHRLQIAKLNYSPGISGTGDSAIFTYNHKGNPVSIIRSITSTGATNYFFRYDHKHRLTDYYGVYAGDRTFEFWSRYYYDNKNRIAGDTTYIFGWVSDEGPISSPNAPDPYDTLYVSHTTTYHYDHANRVIEVKRAYNGGGGSSNQYTYNAAGNLEKRTIIYHGYDTITTVYSGYDDKVNMHRTHPVWQFVDLDFSRNNPFTAQTYNAQGLPVRVIAPDQKLESEFLLMRYGILDVTYTAKP